MNWLLLDTGGDPLDTMARVGIKVFSDASDVVFSANPSEPHKTYTGPEEEALLEAIDELLQRRGVPTVQASLTLIPLDEARTIDVTQRASYGIRSRGSLDLSETSR